MGAQSFNIYSSFVTLNLIGRLSDGKPRTDGNGGRPIEQSVQVLENKDNILSVQVNKARD